MTNLDQTAKPVHNSRARRRRRSRYYLPASLAMAMLVFVDEIILKQGTMKGSWFPELLYMFLEALIFGIIIALLTGFSKKPKVNRAFRLVLMVIVTLIFIVNYFIYIQFKIFYDIQTVFNGAGGVITQFMGLIITLITTPEGIIHIILFTIPLIVYGFYQKRDPARRMRPFALRNLCISLVFCLVIDLTAIIVPTQYRNVLTTQYNYQTAVNSFGLFTGFALDIEHMFVGTTTFTYVNPTEDPDASPEPTEEATPTPIIYGENKLDIDFAALAETVSGTLSDMDNYVASLSATHQNEYTGLFEGKNLIMITAEAFSAEVIDPELTPTLYRLATKGINFTDYYQPASAGTTGGEYQIIFGALPTNGGSSFKNMANYTNLMTMGYQLNALGYNGWAFHDNSYTYYSRNITHNTIGYSNGFMGIGNGMEEYVNANVWPESDLEMMEGTIPLYIDEQPFNVYYMTVSGHNGYSYSGNDMTKKNWDKVEDLDYSDTVKGYIAANLELENALTYLVEQLEEAGIADDTVIVLSSDHFPYGLDYGASLGDMPYLSELYGYDVNDYMSRDHNRLIIWSGCLEDSDPIIVSTPVYSLDILPTLSNLFGTEFDSRLFVGRDVFSEAEPLVFNMSYDWKTDKGTYYAWTGTFEPAEGITVSDSYVERINQIVQNKMTYCKGLQSVDYFAHVFASDED